MLNQIAELLTFGVSRSEEVLGEGKAKNEQKNNWKACSDTVVQ